MGIQKMQKFMSSKEFFTTFMLSTKSLGKKAKIITKKLYTKN